MGMERWLADKLDRFLDRYAPEENNDDKNTDSELFKATLNLVDVPLSQYAEDNTGPAEQAPYIFNI